MAATLNRLKNTEVANANPTDQSRKLYDGGGLALLIKPTGAKGWRFNIGSALTRPFRWPKLVIETQLDHTRPGVHGIYNRAHCSHNANR